MIAKIKIILSIIGAAAAAANLLWEFKIPEKKELTLTNIKNANIKLAKGPPNAIKFLWYNGLKANNFFCSSSLYFLRSSSLLKSLKILWSPKNFT